MYKKKLMDLKSRSSGEETNGLGERNGETSTKFFGEGFSSDEYVKYTILYYIKFSVYIQT